LSRSISAGAALLFSSDLCSAGVMASLALSSWA
jgi:hypothetical protein